MIVCSLCDGVDYSILVGAKTFRFSFSDRFGPHIVDKYGREINEPAPRSPFWRAVSLWRLQGKRVENGVCVWNKPRQPVLEKRGRYYWFFVEDGEPGWDW